MFLRKIMVVTGSRAEYGLLKPLIFKLKDKFETDLVVTGTHLSPEFGFTLSEIESDGLHADEKVEMLLSTDTRTGVVKSMGVSLISFADVFDRLKPDLVLLLGDRFEILSVASAAALMKIPIAHLHGGELTEGAVDDSIRHAVTKLSHLHFTSADVYRKRVIQMGEQPEYVYNVGALGIDNIVSLKLLNRRELEENLNCSFINKSILITYHPVTLESLSVDDQLDNLFEALDSIEKPTLFFTKANADAEGRYINHRVEEWISQNKNAYLFDSLGVLLYLSLMKTVDAVVGNSSSGIIEAPSLKTPTVNIGERQRGRIHPDTVIDCSYSSNDIKRALSIVLRNEFRESCSVTENPYGNGTAAEQIVEILDNIDPAKLIPKKFYDWK